MGRLLLHPRKVGIELAEEMGAELGLRITGAEPANAGFLEDVVASEDLVGALPGQNDLHIVVPDQPG